MHTIKESHVAVPLDVCVKLLLRGDVGETFARKMDIRRKITGRCLDEKPLAPGQSVDQLEVGQTFAETSTVAKGGMLGALIPTQGEQKSTLTRVSPTRLEALDTVTACGGCHGHRSYALERIRGDKIKVCMQPWVVNASNVALSGMVEGLMRTQMAKGDAIFDTILLESYRTMRA